MEAEILKNLVEIKEILSTKSSEWMPAVFALLGVFIAGLWQFLNTKINLKALNLSKELEIKSEIISKQRQQWMDQIRKVSAEFLAEYDVIVCDMGKDLITQEEHDVLYKSANAKGNLITLMLNPNKESQKSAMQALTKIQSIVNVYEQKGIDVALKEYDEVRDKFAKELLTIFGETWKQIKRLE